MLSRRDELESFKTRIHLGLYASSCGYLLDRKSSSRSSLLMHHANGDKVVIALDHDGHWIYFSVRDERDNGSIIDFVQRRQGGSLGDVRKILRAFSASTPSPALLQSGPLIPTLVPASTDAIRVRTRFEAMGPIAGRHPYLEEERQIPLSVLGHPRFFDRIRSDERHNAIFPHWNLSGLCGYEIKNRHFTGFSPGGEKGLWASRMEEHDTELIITETAIDALSHFAIRTPEKARYISTAGTLNSSQPELIRRAAQKLPAGGRVVLATDNDAGGDHLAQVIKELLSQLPGLEILEDRPSERGLDWNDVLKKKTSPEPKP